MQTALEHLQRIGVELHQAGCHPGRKAVIRIVGLSARGADRTLEGMGQPGVKKKWPAWDERLRPAVYAFDRLAFGADRSAMLASLIADSPVAPLVAITPEGQLEGFALARPGRRAFYIGPVAARGPETALALLDGMLGRLAGEKVYLDFNTGFGLSSEVLADRGLVKQRDLTQMAFRPGEPGRNIEADFRPGRAGDGLNRRRKIYSLKTDPNWMPVPPTNPTGRLSSSV